MEESCDNAWELFKQNKISVSQNRTIDIPTLEEITKKCSDLYDFCRVIDNIADDEGELEIKKLKFLEFKKSFFNKDLSSEKIKNMWELVNEFSISVKIIEDLFDGVEGD